MRPRSRSLLALLTAAGLLAAAVPAASAYPRPGRTIRLSQTADGTEANAFSRAGVVSSDGTTVAFVSMASNLVPGDTNGTFDVFVHDLGTGELERVSVSSEGEEGNGPSFLPDLSADGRFVAFASTASNLAPGDSGTTQDVFVHDRATGQTERLTRRGEEVEPRAEYWVPTISADGSRVAFYEHISNLPGECCTERQVHVHDRTTGETVLVSRSAAGEPANNLAHEPAISADGRFVVFSSAASNLVPGDQNSAEDVFVHDTESGITELASVSGTGEQGNAWSVEPSVSADGRLVAFLSAATNMVPGDTNSYPVGASGENGGDWDVFVRDREAGTTERVSVASDGTEANHRSSSAMISDDGRTVVFVSHASNLVPGDDNGTNDVFVHDRVAGATDLASVAGDGGFPDDSSFAPSLSGDGGVVAFGSRATDLGGETTPGLQHSYVRLHGPPAGVSLLEFSEAGGDVAASGWATFTGAVLSGASDAAGDAPAPLGDAGGDLVEAEVVQRPEKEDLLVRWRVAEMPDVLGVAGLPGVTYGLELEAEGVRYRVRGTTPGVFVLERCDGACLVVETVGGSVGTTGHEARAAIPLASLGLTEGDAVTGIVASASLGGLSDEVELPDGVVAERQVRLGVAPASAKASEVAFSAAASLQDGEFAGAIGSPGGQGPHALWARACLGDLCGAARRSLP